MKKIFAALLVFVLTLSLAACGGKNGNSGNNGDNNASDQQKEAPDLNKYYEDFMATLGEDNTPAMMDVEGDMVEQVYPGLGTLETKQLVIKNAMISAVAYEFVLVEAADADGAQTAADILQARIDYQIETGAFYPMTLESWEKAKIITQGNVVALICASGEQEQAEKAFNALFE